MGRELQKRKKRSSIAKVRQKPKSKKKIFNNPIIAANWDPKQTLTQNYRRLGLATKLNAPAGGVERKVPDITPGQGSEAAPDTKSARAVVKPRDEERLAITNKHIATDLIPSEVTVERDPETGRILRVVEAQAPKPARRRLDDPLNAFDDDDDDENDEEEDDFKGFDDHATNGYIGTGGINNTHDNGGATSVVDQLEAHVAQMQQLPKNKRKQSDREVAWIKSLIERHGDDFSAMARDHKLNVMQQSRGDIERRVRKFLATARD